MPQQEMQTACLTVFQATVFDRMQLRKLRQERDLTQEAMAEKVGMDARYYQRIESDKPNAVKIDTLDKLAKALNIPVWKLLRFKN